VVAQGDALDPMPGVTVGLCHEASFNTQSQLCFVANQLGGAPIKSNSVILAGSPTNLVVVALEGDHAPGMPAGVVFADLTLRDPVWGEGGHVGFWAKLAGDGIARTNDRAIWVGRPGALQPVARRGDPARDMPMGVVYHTTFSTTFDLAGINRNGKVAYIAKVEGTGVTHLNQEGLWGGTPGFENLLLRLGQAIDLGGGVTGEVFRIDMVDVKAQLQVGGGGDGRARSLNDLDQYVCAVDFWAPGGSAILVIEDVTDPDANGLPRVLEDAHGLSPGEGAEIAAPRFVLGDGRPRLVFRQSNNATNLSVRLQAAPHLGARWKVQSAISNAADQLGLPAGVVRKEALLDADSGHGFLRVGVSVTPPLQ